MPAMNRRGMTFIELMVALALFSVIAAAAFSALTVNQRTHAALRQNMDLQQNMRAGASLLPAELRELNAVDGDITAMSSTSVAIRAMRRMAFLCQVPVLGGILTARTMTIRRAPLFGARAFNPGDSLLVYYEGNAEIRTDDAWALAQVIAVANVNCPDGAAGQQLTVNMNLGASPNTANAITVGAPVRGFERVRYYSAQNGLDGNRYYIGMQTPSGTQPLIGPLDGSTGFEFVYYDAAGAVTAIPANVALIEIRIRASTARVVHRSSGPPSTVADSLMTSVDLRNNRRF